MVTVSHRQEQQSSRINVASSSW